MRLPLMARLRHAAMSAQWSLSGGKRTSRGSPISVAIDPTRKSPACSRGAKKLQITLQIEPARGRDGAVVGVVAGHLNFRNGKRGGAFRSPFARPSGVGCTLPVRAPRSGSRKTSPVCLCPSRQCCRVAPARRDRRGGGRYPGTHGFDWAENRPRAGWRHLQYRPTRRR